jgi:hypothetical protein
MKPARCLGPLRAGRGIGLLVHLPGVEVWKHLVAEVFQNERLAPVAHDQPVILVDSHFVIAQLQCDLAGQLFDMLERLATTPSLGTQLHR